LEIVGAGNLEDMIETDVAREQWPEMAVSRAIMGYGPRKGPPNKAFILAFHKRTSTLRAICRQDRVANVQELDRKRQCRCEMRGRDIEAGCNYRTKA
jgi:hypothetical protein